LNARARRYLPKHTALRRPLIYALPRATQMKKKSDDGGGGGDGVFIQAATRHRRLASGLAGQM